MSCNVLKYDTHAKCLQLPDSSVLRIAGHAISVKLHPQEVLAAKRGTQYACSKRSEIDSSTKRSWCRSGGRKHQEAVLLLT